MILSAIFAALFTSLFTSPTTPHCIYEDGSELTKPGQTCKWDASEDGINGLGQSFVVVIDSKGDPQYIYADGSVER